ncbi:hypothetical protein LAHI110946_00215 [Lactococcus hircilactis]
MIKIIKSIAQKFKGFIRLIERPDELFAYAFDDQLKFN